MTGDTIFALATGQPPAAIAIIRISGPSAHEALRTLAGFLPEPRMARLASLRHAGEVLDRALVLRFDGPDTVTGDDLIELHLHGGRAVIAAVTDVLGTLPGLRAAEAGEFTRRALANGKMDLTEVEGLADLLAAETEGQRRTALRLAGGALSRKVEEWTGCLLDLAAAVEAQLDFSDEDDVVSGLPLAWEAERRRLSSAIHALLARPPAERLRDGVRVLIAGPPNSGKSSLFNALLEREAAIVSPVAGTTRDLIEASVTISGLPFRVIDSAGLRDTCDSIEAAGVRMASEMIEQADVILWLGASGAAPSRQGVILVAAKADIEVGSGNGGLPVSAKTGTGILQLIEEVIDAARSALPTLDEVSINARQRRLLGVAVQHLDGAQQEDDFLLVAEDLRQARLAFDAITGRADVEALLDGIFARFCIGK